MPEHQEPAPFAVPSPRPIVRDQPPAAPPHAPLHRIQTREQLIEALNVAAEIEHALACQYLYAGFTIKRMTEADLDPALSEATRGWAMSISLIARQEMEHMGLVFNMLAAIGAPTHFQRPRFPIPAHAFPLDLRMDLAPFSKDTVKTFVLYESPPEFEGKAAAPEGHAEIVEDVKRLSAHRARLFSSAAANEAFHPPTDRFPRAATSITQLYVEIREGFYQVAKNMGGADKLFTGSLDLQVDNGDLDLAKVDVNATSDAYNIKISKIHGLENIRPVIDRIIEEGEGAPFDGRLLSREGAPRTSYDKNSHYMRFRQILADLEAAPERPWAYPAVHNPQTLPGRGGTLITNETTLRAAFLFNEAYHTMLLVMSHVYGNAGLSDNQKTALTTLAFFPMMTMVIRPVGELLVTMPATDDVHGPRAGPPFEIPIGLARQTSLAADIQRIDASLQRIMDRADSLANDLPKSRMPFIASNVRRMVANFRQAYGVNLKEGSA